MSQQKVRRMVWTGAIAAVTATGAWYGAGLKMRREIEQVTQKVRELTPEEKIAQLEEIRATFVTKQMGIQRKIDELRRRKAGMTREESMQGRERRRKE